MRHLIFCTCLLLFASCSTQKAVQKDVASSLDSLLRSEQHRSFERLDSLTSSLRMEFDTLEVVIERPIVGVATPEIPHTEVIRVRAVRGSLDHSRREHSRSEELEERCDTVALRTVATDNSVERIDRVTAYTPPNGNWVVVVVVGAIIFIGMLVLWYLHKRLRL